MSTTEQPVTDAVVDSVVRAHALLAQVDELEQLYLELEARQNEAQTMTHSGACAGKVARQLEELGYKLDEYIEAGTDAVIEARTKE